MDDMDNVVEEFIINEKKASDIGHILKEFVDGHKELLNSLTNDEQLMAMVLTKTAVDLPTALKLCDRDIVTTIHRSMNLAYMIGYYRCYQGIGLSKIESNNGQL
jgi:hypothetical protein